MKYKYSRDNFEILTGNLLVLFWSIIFVQYEKRDLKQKQTILYSLDENEELDFFYFEEKEWNFYLLNFVERKTNLLNYNIYYPLCVGWLQLKIFPL